MSQAPHQLSRIVSTSTFPLTNADRRDSDMIRDGNEYFHGGNCILDIWALIGEQKDYDTSRYLNGLLSEKSVVSWQCVYTSSSKPHISMCSKKIYGRYMVNLLSHLLKNKGHLYTEAKELILLSSWLEMHHIKPYLEFNIPTLIDKSKAGQMAPFMAKSIEKLAAIKSTSMAHFFENTASLINER